MSRTDNACEVCGRVNYPHVHSDTAQALMEVTGQVTISQKTDTTELRRLAEAHENRTAVIRPDRWMDAAPPSTVIALLDELDALRAVEKAARDERDDTYDSRHGMCDRWPCEVCSALTALDAPARLRTEGKV